MGQPLSIKDFRGGLNLTQDTVIKDNQFTILKNFYYNASQQLETRRGYRTFGNSIGNNPITSYHFFQRDDTLATQALCTAGTNMYKYNEWTGNRGSIKSGLTEYETISALSAHRTRWDFAVYRNVVYWCNGVDDYFSYDGATYTAYAAQPNIRYISYLGDRVFGAGDDSNPSSLYYTAAAAANANSINTNTLVVGGDENGRINGMTELGQVILAMKSNKVYSINVSGQSALPIDAHNWGFCNRSIKAVANSIVYFTDKGIDTLKPRDWVSGAWAIESSPLGDAIRALTDQITEFQFNSWAAFYNKSLSNYYFAFDTNNDNIPDTVLVYSTLTSWWSQYTLPNLYDFGFYINSDQERQYLFASAITGQMYEFEYGFDDNGVAIDYELESKRFDFGTPWLNNTYDYVDLIGYAALWCNIDVQIKVEWSVVSQSTITDSNLDINSVAKTLWVSAIGTSALTWADNGTDIDLYRYVFRVPLYAMWSDISFNMASTGWVWILEQARISKNEQPIDVFYSSNIG